MIAFLLMTLFVSLVQRCKDVIGGLVKELVFQWELALKKPVNNNAILGGLDNIDHM